MKQFERWWKVAYVRHCWGKSGYDKNIAKKTWKAAIEWALEGFDSDIYHIIVAKIAKEGKEGN